VDGLIATGIVAASSSLLLVDSGTGPVRVLATPTVSAAAARRALFVLICGAWVAGTGMHVVTRSGMLQPGPAHSTVIAVLFFVGAAAVLRGFGSCARAEQDLEEARRSEAALAARLRAIDDASAEIFSALQRIDVVGIQPVLETMAASVRAAASSGWVAIGYRSLESTDGIDRWACSGWSEGPSRLSPPLEAELSRLAEDGARRAVPLQPASALAALGFHAGGWLLALPVGQGAETIGAIFAHAADASPRFDVVEPPAARAAGALALLRAFDTATNRCARLEEIVEELPEAVIVSDGEGKVTLASAAARMVGLLG
jgi:PAS domain-containing protein